MKRLVIALGGNALGSNPQEQLELVKHTAKTIVNLSNEGYTMKDVDAFLIAFCKQVDKYSPTVATEHAYMYYVLYYCF